jgi:hypothetical protein
VKLALRQVQSGFESANGSGSKSQAFCSVCKLRYASVIRTRMERILCKSSLLFGVQPNEQTPNLALYAIDARGKAAKLVAGAKGQIDLGADTGRITGTIALGPDVPDPSTLDASVLQKFSAAQVLPVWTKNPEVELPAQVRRQWLIFRVCVAGKVSKCLADLPGQDAAPEGNCARADPVSTA